MVQKYWSKMKEGALAALPLILILISAFLFIVGFFSLSGSPTAQSICFNVATAILASGVFAAVLKSFQFIGIFRDAIADAMYRDPKFLEKLNLPHLMRDIISASLVHRFPELPKLMSEAVFSDYLTFAKDYYYKNMHRRIAILSYDPQTDFVTFSEEFRLTIKTSPEQEVKYSFDLQGELGCTRFRGHPP